MRSRARAMGHSIHPILIVFPLGLFSTAVIFDIIHLINGNPGFPLAAGYAIAVGVIGGLVAAVFGLIDWLAVPVGTRAKRVGLLHGIGFVVVVMLFALSWLLRANNGAGGTPWQPDAGALVLSFAGVVVAGVSGWLGGELVERLGIGVHENASPDAPSSLRS
jgi:uncharacterized membrane protein